MIKNFLCLGLLLLGLASPVQAANGLNIFQYPREAPQDKFYNQYGGKVSLSDFKGQFVILVFWSRYCVPCIKELDNLNNFHNKTKKNGIKVMIISRMEEWKNLDELRKFLKKFKADDLDFYLDEKSKITESFGIFAYPHTVLINKAGQEIGRIRGAVIWDDDEVIEYMYKIKAQHG